MDTTGNAFTISTYVGEEDLIDLAAVVDALDNLRTVIETDVEEPAEDRGLTEYIKRAVDYLEFLRRMIEAGNVLTISSMPITESVIRQRISQVLRSSLEQGDSSYPLR